MKNKKLQNTIIILIMLFATAVSSIFIFKKGIYEGVDTQYHLSRIIGITNSWKSGDLLAFIHLDTTGYGYAMGFFYSNIFMVIPCILYLLGVNLIVAYKIFIIICGFLTALSMYICVKKITNSKYSAIISSVLYTTCGYRIVTLVAKAFLGELLSFIFIPIIILGLYELIFNNQKKWWIFAIGFIGILNSNLVMTEIMILISALMIIFNIKKIITNKERILGFVKATLLTLVLCAVFWMPMIEQLSNSTFEMQSKMTLYRPTYWLLDFKKMFFGTIQVSTNLAAAYSLGIIFVIILFFRLKIKEKNTIIKFCDISIVVGLLLLICMTNFFPWKYLEKFGEMIQFPSRLEIPAVAFLSIASGIILGNITKENLKKKKVILIVLIIWQTIFSVICLNSCLNILKDLDGNINDFIDDNFEYDVCDGVYLPQGAHYTEAKINNLISNEDSYTTNNEELDYSFEKEGLSIKLKFKNNNIDGTYIEVPMYYYYGYVAIGEKGENYKIEKGEEGKIRVYLEDSKSDTIKLNYKYTTIQILSVIITITSTIGTITYIVVKGFNKNEKEGNKKRNS